MKKELEDRIAEDPADAAKHYSRLLEVVKREYRVLRRKSVSSTPALTLLHKASNQSDQEQEVGAEEQKEPAKIEESKESKAADETEVEGKSSEEQKNDNSESADELAKLRAHL